MEVPRVHLTLVVERHRVLQHHVHHTDPSASRYTALATVTFAAAGGGGDAMS
jgi:hypothetical protein